LIHLGTALLRLETFFPYPKLMDFAAFYAGAWAVRLGVSPYEWSAELLERLRAETGLSIYPPTHHSPPLWAWLLQPLTFFAFPTAAIIWLLLLLAFIIWSAMALAQLAGYKGWKEKAVILFLAVTFGPVFLNLTLGQNGVFLLVAALIIGQALRVRTWITSLLAALAWVPAVGAKLSPLIWIGALPLLQRWRLFVLAILILLLVLGLASLLTPTASRDYWLRFLPERIFSYSEEVGIDDQSLVAWLDRLGRPHTFGVPGLSVTQQHTVIWSPPWSVDPHVIRLGGYFLVALLALIPIAALLRVGPAQAEGAFYLWVLYGLLIFPHTERYNHVLLLPAMAWLWSRGGPGRTLVILTYFLVGLSRLTHLWAILLPAPWGPLASGFGLYAVFLLGGGMAISLLVNDPRFRQMYRLVDAPGVSGIFARRDEP
jgi:hypothetical protein